jgi:hypothetical protein
MVGSVPKMNKFVPGGTAFAYKSTLTGFTGELALVVTEIAKPIDVNLGTKRKLMGAAFKVVVILLLRSRLMELFTLTVKLREGALVLQGMTVTVME